MSAVSDRSWLSLLYLGIWPRLRRLHFSGAFKWHLITEGWSSTGSQNAWRPSYHGDRATITVEHSEVFSDVTMPFIEATIESCRSNNNNSAGNLTCHRAKCWLQWQSGETTTEDGYQHTTPKCDSLQRLVYHLSTVAHFQSNQDSKALMMNTT